MTFKLDLDSVKVNQHATHLPQGPQLLPRQTDTHTHTGPIAVTGTKKWSVTKSQCVQVCMT